VVSVKDTGVGIPRAKLDSIFDMFMQLEGSLQRSQGGLGIGLTLVKRLVEMHGGNNRGHEAMEKVAEAIVSSLRLPGPDGIGSAKKNERARGPFPAEKTTLLPAF
jgi:signal transduction histidine kinase